MITVIDCASVGKGKYRVVFDTGVTCLLYRGEATRFSISKGESIEDSEYYELITDVLTKRCRKRALHLLEQMDRSENKLREKLALGEYPKECIDDAISYVKSFNYLSDERMARNYVRYHQNALSRGQLKTKLLQKGISRDDVDTAIEEEYIADETEHIIKLLQKKKYCPNSCDEKEFAKIYNYILRRGFKSSDVMAIMKKYGSFYDAMENW